MTRTCVDDMDNDAEGVFNRQAPKCARKSINLQCEFQYCFQPAELLF